MEICQKYIRYLAFLNYQDSNTRTKNNHFSAEFFSSSKEVPPEFLMENLNIVVVDIIDLENLDVIIVNVFSNFCRSEIGSKKNVGTKGSVLRSCQELPPKKNKETVPSLSERNHDTSRF